MIDLEDLLDRQHRLQVESFELDPLSMRGSDRADYLRWNVLALTDELHEAMREGTWKPWSTKDEFDADAMMDELVDALHFMLNLLLLCGGSMLDSTTMLQTGCTYPQLYHAIAAMIGNRYLQKHKTNAKRQTDGYDG